MRQQMRRTVRVVGVVMATVGLVAVLYGVYERYGASEHHVSGETEGEQQVLSEDLESSWETGGVEGERGDRAQVDESSGVPAPELGDAFARMWAPDIRAESWTLVEGFELEDIRYAPGRYPNGALPGEQGNFSLAGHNVPEIFQHIRELEPGDKVVIETMENFYVYEVVEHVIVDETQVEILSPVPEQPGVEPGEDDYWLTLLTCNPLWDNYERYVVYAQLDKTIEREPGGDLPKAAVDSDA